MHSNNAIYPPGARPQMHKMCNVCEATDIRNGKRHGGERWSGWSGEEAKRQGDVKGCVVKTEQRDGELT
jgi:hypothetical protein